MDLTKQLKELFFKWHDFLANHKKYSIHTVNAYLSDLQIFFKFLVGYKQSAIISFDIIQNLGIEDVRAFLKERDDKKIKAISRARELASLKNFLIFISENEGVNLEIINLINYPKLSKSLPKSVSYNEIKQILSALLLDKDWLSYRDYVIILTIYSTGIRISEALNITLRDINRDFLIIKGKGDKERYVGLLDEIYDKIQIYLKKIPYKVKDYIFLGEKGAKLSPRIIQRKLKKIREEFLLPEFTTPHALRHSFATHMLENGANLKEIQEILGHKNLTTTEKYIAMSKNKIIKKYQHYHPRENG